MDASTLSLLIQNFGPTGAIAVLGIYALRGLMPLVVAAVGHLGKIADAMQVTSMQVQALDTKVTGVVAEQADTNEKLAILVDRQTREDRRPRPARAASGD